MAKCQTNCIEKRICVGFEIMGRFIGGNPWWFLIIPVLLSAALGGGFSFLEDREANDIEEQFTPVNGKAKMERLFVQQNFPQNDSMFSPQRLDTEGTYASILVSSGNILTREAFKEILSLNERVMNVSVQVGDEHLTYKQLCAISDQACFSNPILDIVQYNSSNIESINLTFPWYNSKVGYFFLGSSLGGVVMANDSIVKQAKAVRLFFYLRDDNHASNMWLQEFIRAFSEENQRGTVSVSCFASISRQKEFEENSKNVIPLFSATYFLAISFSIVSCLRLDNVRNKVWVATFGVLSTGLSVLSSFGLLLYIGVPFVMTVATSPFLILGIGVDDMFILLSSWQQTNVHDGVQNRLADTYKEAAVSITITTLTDVLAFYIGVMTSFGSVRSFCLYTGTTVLFCYVYSITFFGAVLALNGRREKSNRHWMTCMVVPSERPPERSRTYHLCCVGGAYDEKTNTEEAQPVTSFFKNYYGPFLTNLWTKVFVIFLYAVYLAVSIYGCCKIETGIKLQNLASDDSYVVRYYNHEDEYFVEYGPNVMVVVKDEVVYWNETERAKLNKCIEDIQNTYYVDQTILTSWLEQYTRYAELVPLNIKNETMFKEHLISFLDRSPMFWQDLNFTDNNIYASRFFVQTVNVKSALDEEKMLKSLREKASECDLLVYHPAFIYYDQYAVIVDNTIQNILVATAVMLVVSLLLIPNPLCSLWVTFAIASVIVGVAGFMTLWEVNLDSISMINLVICIGFSVDFSAHISYSFVSNEKSNLNEKAIDGLYTLGYPIVQGAVSTILGVVVLSAAKSYIFRTFFKIMFLVIFFGLVHGIVFLPVFLTFFGICSK